VVSCLSEGIISLWGRLLVELLKIGRLQPAGLVVTLRDETQWTMKEYHDWIILEESMTLIFALSSSVRLESDAHNLRRAAYAGFGPKASRRKGPFTRMTDARLESQSSSSSPEDVECGPGYTARPSNMGSWVRDLIQTSATLFRDWERVDPPQCEADACIPFEAIITVFPILLYEDINTAVMW